MSILVFYTIDCNEIDIKYVESRVEQNSLFLTSDTSKEVSVSSFLSYPYPRADQILVNLEIFF